MNSIHIANERGRDAEISTRSVTRTTKARLVDANGRQVRSARLLSGDISHDAGVLADRFGGLEGLGRELIDGDPEIDLESTGRLISGTSRVFVDDEGEVALGVKLIDVIKGKDGTEIERRPRAAKKQNVNTDIPLKWGRLLKKAEVYNRFVFKNKIQLVHTNGLTYDFLYEIAKRLETEGAMMRLAAGPRSAEPLVFERGGTPYQGFLEGRTDGERYVLILHLANMELKVPREAPE